MEKEKGFFGFIIDAQSDKPLSEKFKKIKNLSGLKKFFTEDNPFYGLSTEEIERIWAAREALCQNSTEEEVWEVICGGRGY